MRSADKPCRQLGLRAGDSVEVRGVSEILSTLDQDSKLDGLPFMPEMLQFCGKRFTVSKRVDKTCDTILADGLRRMTDTVLLDNLRCDGGAHEGCQAGCTIFWKEAWLRRIPSGTVVELRLQQNETQPLVDVGVSMDSLFRATRVGMVSSSLDSQIFRCQATEMRGATSYLAWWDPRQYWRDIRSGNVGGWPLIRAFFIWLFNVVQRWRRGAEYPYIEGKLKKTPHVEMDLQPGELVRLKPRSDILLTLDARNRNRGLSFDRELVKYCGGTYRVLRRVNKIINEKTGKMIRLTNPCIVLEGVTCTGDYNRYCPRNIFHYVREAWLERATERDTSKAICDFASDSKLALLPCNPSPDQSTALQTLNQGIRQ